MAEVVAPGDPALDTDPPELQPRRLHGKKRAADGQPESEQRLSKRFDLLNLDNGTRLYLPVASSSDAALTPDQSARPSAKPNPGPVPVPVPVPAAPKTEKKRQPPRRPPPPEDCMQVEDTPHRVYIADLDAELSDIESDEDNPIFLSDIEKHLAKIPKHVLTGPEPTPTPTHDNQLILYRMPSSLTVPEAHDSVRKVIVEARRRIRERQASGTGSGSVEPAPAPAAAPAAAAAAATATEIPPPPFDSDAMDID
ncbi:hypothetical protein PMIN03_009747 [Paraphaeosphaeria minitans]|uniref:Uncharacterized protein n=1 Tax=Paraphaeosphaeria minitans TaxID=565426 RepID=A0A9P6GJ24_9PLEO|nr:hypothetical protein PMIN01_05800 [Paraphaeosphaeria minitans]